MFGASVFQLKAESKPFGLLKTQSWNHPPAANGFENYRFTKSNVLFVVAHIVGSNNNYWPQSVVAMNEFRERNTATLAFLKESFTLAERQKFAGVILIIHANPNFENSGEYEYGNGEGFVGFLNLLHQLSHVSIRILPYCAVDLYYQ